VPPTSPSGQGLRMNKKQLCEQEIRTRHITPAIQEAGWKPQQIREEVTFPVGRIIVHGTPSAVLASIV